MPFAYRWTHIPSGTTGVRSVSESEMETHMANIGGTLLWMMKTKSLNKIQALCEFWNEQQPTIWKYEAL